MAELRASTLDEPIGDLLRHNKSSRRADDRCLSRAERLEIISLMFVTGSSECAAWITPMLERGGPDDDFRMETVKC